MMRLISTIAFDADDTLWHNTLYYNLTEDTFTDLLSEFSTSSDLKSLLLETERRNLRQYGFGIKGFTLSMLETAIQVTDERVPVRILRQILDLGKELQTHPIELFSGVSEVISRLAGFYRVALITKGDLLDQERKIAQSGLGDVFHQIEIVSDKTRTVYERIFSEGSSTPAACVMVGNSVKSDVRPAIEAGAWGVFVPCEHDWEFETAQLPRNSERFRTIRSISELPLLIEEIEAHLLAMQSQHI